MTTDFSQYREARPYLSEPRAMHVGAPGKCGFLDLVFELTKEGKSIMRHWERHAPLIVQQELYFDEEMPEMPCVYILSSGGPNIDGDRYENRFTVRKNAFAHISTGAATKIAEMRYNFSALKQKFVLEEKAYLEYIPEPTIPCRNSRYITDTRIVIAPSATLFYSEIYTGGRKYYKDGELFQYDLLSLCTQAQRPDGTPLFREKLVATPKENPVTLIGIMHDYDVFANVLILTPETDAIPIYKQTQTFINRRKSLAVGISYLPNQCGLILKILGNETQSVKRLVREFCSTTRMQVKQKALPAEFIWKS